MSPTAIVLAGGGVALGELGHLGLAVALMFGAVGYGARLAWAAVARRRALARRDLRRLDRIDPWSVPEPWRGYTTRALEARKRFRELAQDCAPGPVAGYLAGALPKVDAVVEEQWALARSGAALAGPAGRAAKVAHELSEVQDAVRSHDGAERSQFTSREEALAAELRSLRHTEAAGLQISERLSVLCGQLEGLVAAAGALVATSGAAGAELGDLSTELASLAGALDEVKRIMGSSSPEGIGGLPDQPAPPG